MTLNHIQNKPLKTAEEIVAICLSKATNVKNTSNASHFDISFYLMLLGNIYERLEESIGHLQHNPLVRI